jgi:hypothetical protein
MLAAAALGLSTVWVGKFDEGLVREIAGVPAGQRPVAMLPLGYAANHRRRRELRDLIHEVSRSKRERSENLPRPSPRAMTSKHARRGACFLTAFCAMTGSQVKMGREPWMPCSSVTIESPQNKIPVEGEKNEM